MRKTIANIGPFEFFVSRTYGHYHILPCLGQYGEPGFKPGITIIGDARDRLDMGEMQYQWIPILANDHEGVTPGGEVIQVPGIATDLVKNEHLEQFGVFVCEGPQPTADEMEKAHQTMLAACQVAIQRADAEWARYHRHELIEDNARRACLLLGEEREWAYQVVQRVVCPVCGKKNPEGIARCQCGAILDVDIALKFGVITKEHAKELRELRKGVKLQTTRQPVRPPIPAREASSSLSATSRDLVQRAGDFAAVDVEEKEGTEASS